MTTESATENDKLNKKIIEWACHYLSSHGYTLKNNSPENVQITPWSDVVRFATSDGYIYLKHTPKLLSLEANIIQILQNQFHISVPNIIAHHAELNCFLMKDAGKKLREILKQQFDTTLFCKAIEQFTAMQITVADHLDIFLNLGVPDWRLEKLPDLYMQLLSQKEMLMEDGLSEKEISELKKLLPTISILCEKLSGYAIKQSIVQPDFNDNNTLINEISKNITIIDLGEIAISHPFFSLINCLQQANKHHAVKEGDDNYQQLLNACFKNFMMNETKNNLLEALTLARILYFIYSALADYRLLLACEKKKFTALFQRHGRMSIALKELLIACNAIEN